MMVQPENKLQERTLKVQIYAFTDVDEARRAVALGVDHIGFVAGDYGEVHAELSFDQARALRDAVSPQATAVALTMATDVLEIAAMARAVRPDIVHISTDPYAVDLAATESLRELIPQGMELIKAIPVGGEESIKLATRFAPLVDYLLLDTKMDGMPGVGATGATHDWSISRSIVESVTVPVILAGGLTPGNVAEAIEAVAPWGVDSNTGTNMNGDPVAKDFSKIAGFVHAARGGQT